MSLTSPWFLGLVVLVLVTVFLALILSWARWGGPGRRAALTRAGLLSTVNLLVLLTAGVAVNDHFLFFADWADLGGAVGWSPQPQPSSGHVGGDAREATSKAYGRSPAPGPDPAGAAARFAPGTRQARFVVRGARSGISATVVVFLPAGYTDPAQAQRRYPVLEGFPGYPGGPFNPSEAVAQTVGAARMSDPIILSPVIQIPTGRDTECVDGSARDPQVETWLTQDVPDWAAHTLRVQPDRSAWATIGWSVGGWCAAMAAMLHPDRYCAGIVLGGYFRPLFGSLYRPFTPDSVQERRYDLVSLAAHRPPAVALWVQTSRVDALSYPTTSQLLARARPPLSIQSLVMGHAGHRITIWETLLPQALAWLGDTAAGFAPGATSPTGASLLPHGSGGRPDGIQGQGRQNPGPQGGQSPGPQGGQSPGPQGGPRHAGGSTGPR